MSLATVSAKIQNVISSVLRWISSRLILGSKLYTASSIFWSISAFSGLTLSPEEFNWTISGIGGLGDEPLVYLMGFTTSGCSAGDFFAFDLAEGSCDRIALPLKACEEEYGPEGTLGFESSLLSSSTKMFWVCPTTYSWNGWEPWKSIGGTSGLPLFCFSGADLRGWFWMTI